MPGYTAGEYRENRITEPTLTKIHSRQLTKIEAKSFFVNPSRESWVGPLSRDYFQAVTQLCLGRTYQQEMGWHQSGDIEVPTQ